MKINFIQQIIDKIRGKDLTVLKNEVTLMTSNVSNEIEKLQYLFLPALKKHNETFAKYKNYYNDKDIVVVGSGPTLHSYKMLNNAIHIGVNHTFTMPNLELDYLFIQDNLSTNDTENPEIQHFANVYRKDLCKKFYGIHTEKGCITQKDAIEASAERYYFVDHKIPTSNYATFSSDIQTRPLNEWSSVIFAATEFALWTHPRKLYIVGCDCTSNGHIYTKDPKGWCAFENRFVYGWHQIKSFRDSHYPDVEIISVNPIGLKGLFKDIYTQSYVDSHPELLEESIDIIREDEINVK